MVVPGEAEAFALDHIASAREPLPERDPARAILGPLFGRQIGGDDELDAEHMGRPHDGWRVTLQFIHADMRAHGC